MSGRVVGRVHERIVGSAARKAVLLCLADHSNPDGEMSYPSVNRISQETEYSERAVQTALGWLREQGLIEQTQKAGRHRPATYRINLARLSEMQLVHLYDSQGCRPDALGVQVDASMGVGPAPEPSLTVLEPPDSAGAPHARARDPLFDAIAAVCQVDPVTSGASIAKVQKVLVKGAYTPAEVEAFGRWWWGTKNMRQRPPTLWQLREQIGVVRQAKILTKPGDSREPFIPPHQRMPR